MTPASEVLRQMRELPLPILMQSHQVPAWSSRRIQTMKLWAVEGLSLRPANADGRR